MGYSTTPHAERTGIPDLKKSDIDTTKDALMTMKAHPNYINPTPQKGESPIAFALRGIAHLISPPQQPGESYDLECVDIAASVLAMREELELAWQLYESEK